MASHEGNLETNASTQLVWELWSDVRTWPSWNPDVSAISLEGPFASGTRGSMTTGNGTHDIRLENVVNGRSFDLVTSPMPATTFRFHCEVQPIATGSRVSQGVELSGTLAFIFSPLMGGRIAQSFTPILEGLAKAAESDRASATAVDAGAVPPGHIAEQAASPLPGQASEPLRDPLQHDPITDVGAVGKVEDEDENLKTP